MLKLYDFSIEYIKNPTLIPLEGLRFGWKLESDHTNVLQSSYRIVICKNGEPVIDTGIVHSSALCDITIPSLTLASCTDYTIEVTVQDNHGETAFLSHPVSTELLYDDWGNAEWIKPEEHITGWAPYLRTKFKTSGVKKAVLYASGLGYAEYYINGKRTDDSYLDPLSANYEKTVYYRRFDVTDLIEEGGNAIAVLLGEGFYSQSIVWGFDYGLCPRFEKISEGYEGKPYGDVCVKLILKLYRNDGTVQEITSNPADWTYKYSPITSNNIYAGEIYDSRLETPDFASYDGKEAGWGPVIVDETPKGALTPALMPPVRVIRELPAIEHHGSSGNNDGTWVYDLGENIAGIAEYHIPRSPRGHVYVFRYSEVLNESGSPDHRSTGAYATMCIQQDIYICRGDENGEIYRPRFTYHGYRYVEISGIHDLSSGYSTRPQLSIVTGLQLSTDFEKTAVFSTSYEPLDKLQKIMENTYRSNYHAHPEDCPAREKSGWLGDSQITTNWGLINYDTAASYEKFLHDIRTTTEVYGEWKMVSPGKRHCGQASSLWGCAQLLIPYYLYKYCGDKEAILRNVDLMKGWIEHEKQLADDYIISIGLGDWCPPVSADETMPVSHSSSLMFFEICSLMAELCETFALEEKDYYATLAANIKDSVNRHFYDYEKHSYGHWGSDGVALFIGCYPDGEKEILTETLVNTIIKEDYRMCTGIYANKYLVPVLMEAGYGDVALKFLFHETHTSFATMMNDGATSIWESLALHTVEKNKTLNVGSYDHPMHGGFLYFCFEYLAGIRPTAPGYAEFAFKPCFTSLTKEVKAAQDTVCGKILVEISESTDGHRALLTVPAGSTCIIELDGAWTLNGSPASKGQRIGSGTYEIII